MDGKDEDRRARQQHDEPPGDHAHTPRQIPGSRSPPAGEDGQGQGGEEQGNRQGQTHPREVVRRDPERKGESLAGRLIFMPR
jgi:hypothetical protein